ncbi:MAG: epoxyqueuosine reductase QueH [Eubacterium sp.]|nr:epoxyqueuosine reductase QueH [Eubacterium sp.]
MNRNYQRELDEILKNLSGSDEKKGQPRLLLHCCCAPCSSYVTEYLHDFFDLTLFFYNPNITETEEYEKRKKELKRYLSETSYGSGIRWMDADYEPERFLSAASGLEEEPERGRRCEKCFRLRLEETAKAAKRENFDYFCTTLSISPHKDADLLMRIGEELGEEYGIPYLPSDFKKRGGYQRSIELSREYSLYRQDFCGCIFSKKRKSLF